MIPKAESFYNKKDANGQSMSFNEKMIEFAKLHVEEALKAASEKAKRKKDYKGHPQRLIVKRVIDKDSILKAYPLENIK